MAHSKANRSLFPKFPKAQSYVGIFNDIEAGAAKEIFDDTNFGQVNTRSKPESKTKAAPGPQKRKVILEDET